MAVVDRGVERGDSRLRAELARLVEGAQDRHSVEGKSEVGADPRDGESECDDDDDDAEPVAGLTNRPQGRASPRAVTTVSDTATRTPIAATALIGLASRLDCLTIPGQKTAAERTIPITATTFAERRVWRWETNA